MLYAKILIFVLQTQLFHSDKIKLIKDLKKRSFYLICSWKCSIKLLKQITITFPCKPFSSLSAKNSKAQKTENMQFSFKLLLTSIKQIFAKTLIVFVVFLFDIFVLIVLRTSYYKVSCYNKRLFLTFIVFNSIPRFFFLLMSQVHKCRESEKWYDLE